MPHLLVDISSHGYGHVSQTAPVVNALARRFPDLRVTLRTGAPHSLLAQRFQCEFRHVPLELDFGMKMVSAVEARVAESHAAYLEWHSDWEARVAQQAQRLHELQPDLLLANVPYLSLAAAKVAGVSSVAMCSLNWSDIYRHYCGDLPGGAGIYRQMLDAYSCAEVFFRLEPGMPMESMVNRREVGVVVSPGQRRREALAIKLGLWADERCVLVAMGGMDFRLPMEQWPRQVGVRWLVPAAWGVRRPDVVAFESVGMAFSDLLASCDAVLTKPGYGTFAEAACAGVPVLYAERRDWPEAEYLAGWLTQHVSCSEVGHDRLVQGDLASLLEELWGGRQRRKVVPEGVHVVADYLMRRLDGSISGR